MTGTASRIRIPANRLEDLAFLKGLRIRFASVAEMVTTRAKEIPDRPHLLYYNQVVTYGQSNERAEKTAGFLKRKGVQKGDIVSLMILNSPEIFYCMIGTQKIGAIAGLINFALKAPEIAHVLEDSKPKVVFVGSEFITEFAKALKISSHRPLIIEVKTAADHQEAIAETTLDEIFNTYSADDFLEPQQPDDPFLLLYSSGTTGKPKGILLTNKGQLSVCRDMARLGLVNGNDTMLILLPMFHTNPICVWSYPMTFCGQTLCIRKAFSPQDFWPAIIDNGITILMGVPAMYNYVYYSIDPSTVDQSRLKLNWAFSGAAALSVELIKGFKEKFNVDIIEGYGLTEGTGVAMANPPLGKRKPGSIGLPLWEQQAEILDDHLNTQPAGARGEICIKGEVNMSGYLNNREATSDTLRNGWLLTGDIGYRDDEGYFYVVDRKKDMINRGGENIYPREIEMVLEAHPQVVAVAVIGVPDAALGERVKAILEISEPDALTPEKVRTYLADKLADYKIPEIIEFMDRIPRNPTGKLLKKDLR